MKTPDEIIERIKEIEEGGSFLNFEPSTLIEFLGFDHARPYLKDGVTAAEWEPAPLTDEGVKGKMAEYMVFALDKAQSHRGLSAGRSIDRMKAWLWLLGDDELLTFADVDRNYSNYGVPILRKICEKYSLPMPTGEAWFENMSQGRECRPDCDEGCG